jgi:predicted amidohydrolase
MRIAAIQMEAKFAEVNANLETARRLASEAFQDGAKMVILPEFFTSAMGFHPKMLNVVRPIHGEPWKLLNQLAKQYNGIIGGSFIAFRENLGFNTFVLAFPDGTTYYHDKDQPTMWENCYYIGGKDDGVFETKIGNIGVALCWEFVRSRTATRLLKRVNLVVGGSCWWTIPEKSLPQLPGIPETSSKTHERNVEIMRETPSRFARILGVPVVHAAHAGNFLGEMPLIPDFPYKSYYLGETQIVDRKGKILARLTGDDGEGIIMRDISLEEKCNPSESIPNRFWIPDMPEELDQAWNLLNSHGKTYYRKTTKHYYEKMKK